MSANRIEKEPQKLSLSTQEYRRKSAAEAFIMATTLWLLGGIQIYLETSHIQDDIDNADEVFTVSIPATDCYEEEFEGNWWPSPAREILLLFPSLQPNTWTMYEEWIVQQSEPTSYTNKEGTTIYYGYTVPDVNDNGKVCGKIINDKGTPPTYRRSQP